MQTETTVLIDQKCPLRKCCTPCVPLKCYPSFEALCCTYSCKTRWGAWRPRTHSLSFRTECKFELRGEVRLRTHDMRVNCHGFHLCPSFVLCRHGGGGPSRSPVSHLTLIVMNVIHSTTCLHFASVNSCYEYQVWLVCVDMIRTNIAILSCILVYLKKDSLTWV